MKRIVYGVLAVTWLVFGNLSFLFGKPADLLSYPSKLTSEKQVYDGDTIQDVRIEILDMGSGLENPFHCRVNSGRVFF